MRGVSAFVVAARLLHVRQRTKVWSHAYPLHICYCYIGVKALTQLGYMDAGSKVEKGGHGGGGVQQCKWRYLRMGRIIVFASMLGGKDGERS